MSKEAIHKAYMVVARWFFDARVPFHEIHSPYFKPCLDACLKISKRITLLNVWNCKLSFPTLTTCSVCKSILKIRMAWDITNKPPFQRKLILYLQKGWTQPRSQKERTWCILGEMQKHVIIAWKRLHFILLLC